METFENENLEQPAEAPLAVEEQHNPLAEMENRPELSELRAAVERVKNAMGQLIVGQEEMIDLLIAGVLSDGHLLIEGVPGLAKTLAAKVLARTIEAGFSRIQFTPDLMPSDVLGTSVFNAKTGEFEFHRGPIFSNLILIDEINRAPAKTQAALFEAMEERQVTMDGTTYKMAPPFMVVATQNPIEQEGTYRLPEAQLDRFLFKITLDYPKPEEEVTILQSLHDRKGDNDPESISPVLSVDELKRYRRITKAIHIDANLIQYIVRLTHRTRNSKSLFLGASPRASIHIMQAAKAIAAMRGRSFVTPQDIQYVAPAVVAHRIILTPEKEMEGATTRQVVQQLLDGIEVPR